MRDARSRCAVPHRAAQVNPELYCAFRRPGGVEYAEKDKQSKAVMYGSNADDATPSTCLREGERCPGFPFNPHREYGRSRVAVRATDAAPQGGQQPEQLEQVQKLRIQVRALSQLAARRLTAS